MPPSSTPSSSPPRPPSFDRSKSIQYVPWIGQAQLFSLVTTFLWFYQPLVDRKAVMQGVIDSLFFGSRAQTAAWGQFVVHKLVEFVMISIFVGLYVLRIPSVERLKVFPAKWPWEHDDPHKRQEAVRTQWHAFFFFLKFQLGAMVINILVAGKTGFDDEEALARVDPARIPEWYVSMYQCLVSFTIFEVIYYFAHRAMHTRWLYWIHKRHHEHKRTTIFTGFYASVAEVVLTEAIPAAIGPLYFNMHWYTAQLHLIPYVLNSVYIHCGYRSPRRLFNPILFLPFCTEDPVTHHMHHTHPTCNYGGAYFYLDRIFGTYKSPEEIPTYMKLLQEAERESDATAKKQQ